MYGDTISEFDYRAPTVAEQVAHAQATWDGPRCDHGKAILPFGPDDPCGACEREDEEAWRHAEYLEWMEANGNAHPDPIGPCRVGTRDVAILYGFADREAEPTLDDLPF